MRTAKQYILFLLFCLTSLIPAWGWAQSVNREGGHIVRWAENTTINFVVDEESFRGSPISDPVRLARQAAITWEIHPNIPRFHIGAGRPGPISFHDSEDNDRHSIRFYERSFPPTNRPVLALTLLTRNSVTGEVLDADILFDGGNRFATLERSQVGIPGAPYDFLNVLTHEFGHALGLVEDPQNPDATMFPTSQPGETDKRTLSPPDIASLTEAYANEPTHARRQLGLPFVDTVIAAISVLISLPAIVIALYALFFRKNRSAATTTALYAASALLLILGSPNAHPTTTEHGLVVSSRSFWNRGVMHTVATVQTAHGLERVTRLGGRIGNYEQVVFDAPSGHQLKRGTRVPLHN